MFGYCRHYLYLTLDNFKKDAWILGYPLRLSPTEFRIMVLIHDKHAITTDEIFSILAPSITKQSIPVHINSINKKAVAVSGRKIVIFRTRHYRLNPYM